jgi:hypothetical protein
LGVRLVGVQVFEEILTLGTSGDPYSAEGSADALGEMLREFFSFSYILSGRRISAFCRHEV